MIMKNNHLYNLSHWFNFGIGKCEDGTLGNIIYSKWLNFIALIAFIQSSVYLEYRATICL